MTYTLIIGLLMNAIILPLAAKRVFFLYKVISSGQPAPDRLENLYFRTATAIKGQLAEVLGQKKLLKWSIPGIAHSFVMYAFLILATVYVEAYGVLLSQNPKWAIPIVGRWDVLGFAQDTIAVLCLVGLVLFYFIRLRNQPKKLGRRSRFAGSHLGGAYLVLFMIFNVIWTMLLFRGAAAAAHNLPYGWGAWASQGLGKLLDGLPHDVLVHVEHVGLLLHIGIMLVFLIDVLHSKHLHIFVAPMNVMFKRPDSNPNALGAVKPMMNQGKPVTLEDVEDMDEDTVLGIGSIQDFSWKGKLDFASCTECGRCQSQCPAWNTEKPLSPKMLIMNLRDHAMKTAPYHLEKDEEKRAQLGEDILAEVERPLVGETEGLAWEPTGGAIIDNDVLWSCTNCGACVNQCPVDIEHVDHIIDMRRYQVLVESNFPAELNGLFKGLENKGNPWNMAPTARMEWAQGLDFDVKVVGEDIESMEDAEWLFWVGCAGAYEDRAKKVARSVAELFHIAGTDFAVLGNGETCTGDSARRAGNEFVYQGLAMQNIETFKEFKVKKVVTTCPHCMNTLKNEYAQLGYKLEVVHHTQLLNRLVREGKLTPVARPERSWAGAQARTITYHDPCFLGRHNQVYEAPRELLGMLEDANVVEMPRSAERSFCCGAGGARMWMEETIGERVNVNRTQEAVATGADQIAVGCPFCRTMIEDGLTSEQDAGRARETVEVLDVAQMMLASVKGQEWEPKKVAAPAAKKQAAAGASAPAAAAATATITEERPASSGGSLFDSAPASGPEPAAPASSGGSLFDTPAAPASSGGSLFDTPATPPSGPEMEGAADAKPDEPEAPVSSGGGSLFDVQPTSDAPQAEAPAPAATGGSLFDIPAQETPAPATEAPAQSAPAAEAPAPAPAAPAPTAEASSVDLGSGGSLFDIPAQEAAAPAGPAPTSLEAEAEATIEAKDPSADEPAPAPAEETAVEEAPDEEAVAEQAPQADTSKQDGKPAASYSGEAHQPRTDVDVNKGGSLFDL